jgi:hypothetical protein
MSDQKRERRNSLNKIITGSRNIRDVVEITRERSQTPVLGEGSRKRTQIPTSTSQVSGKKPRRINVWEESEEELTGMKIFSNIFRYNLIIL